MRRFLKKWRKGVMVVASVSVVGVIAFLLWKPQLAPNWDGEHADAILVLGGGEEVRVQTTLRLWKRGVAPTVVLTGDSGWIDRGLREGGLREPSLVIEPAATSTVENARFSKPLLEALGAEEVVLVTSAYHTLRSLRICQQEMPDMNFVIAYEEPDSLDWNRGNALREKFAIVHNWLFRGVPWPR